MYSFPRRPTLALHEAPSQQESLCMWSAARLAQSSGLSVSPLQATVVTWLFRNSDPVISSCELEAQDPSVAEDTALSIPW